MTQGHLLISTTVAVIGWTAIGHGFKLPEQAIDAVYALMLLAYTYFYEHLRNQSKPESKRLSDFATGHIYLSPLVAAMFVVGALQFVERATGAIVGAAIGMSLAAAGRDQFAPAVIPMISPIFALLVASFMMIPIAKYAAHRIQTFSFAWVTGAIAVDVAINVIVAHMVSQRPVALLLPNQAAFTLAFLPGAAIGCLWAKKAQRAYSMSRLFGYLSKPDQEAIIELARGTARAPVAEGAHPVGEMVPVRNSPA